MENYIIRIYRREKGACPNCVGTVEKVGQEGKQVFTHVDELWGILSASEQIPKQKNQERASGKGEAATRNKAKREDE